MIERMNEKIVWEWIRNAEKFKQIYRSIHLLLLMHAKRNHFHPLVIQKLRYQIQDECRIK